MTYRLPWFIVTILLAFNAAAQLATQKDSAGGVTVTVTPTELGRSAKVWVFKVVLDSHSQDLSDDLAGISVLAWQGREAKPLGWEEGAGPGGHHREGMLKFSALEPPLDAVELRINRPGEAKPRTFRWEIK
jgi:hypothetical protein